MSTYDADDRDTRGHFLPENSQRQLQKLRDYAEFLSHIAQPRTPDAEQEGLPKINAEQVAICLEFLVEQMDIELSGSELHNWLVNVTGGIARLILSLTSSRCALRGQPAVVLVVPDNLSNP